MDPLFDDVIGKDEGRNLLIQVADFNFDECMIYLNRNPNELLHRVDRDKGCVTKVIKLGDELVLMQMTKEQDRLVVSFPLHLPDQDVRNKVLNYTIDWLDLRRDLTPFYRLAISDPVLQSIVPRYKGLRIVGVPDLFEALGWAIMGQQVSLHVAYLLKKRLVENFGQSIEWQDKTYWAFPSAVVIAHLNIQDLIDLKFTQKKAEYLVGVARLMNEGILSKENLQQYAEITETEKQLTKIRGIGSWSANYVIMRCLRHPDAFPIADVGLHNALKHVLQLQQKPSVQQIEQWSERWSGWKAYATFYLWRTLLGEGGV